MATPKGFESEENTSKANKSDEEFKDQHQINLAQVYF